MSLRYLREAAAAGERQKVIRYVLLHFGDCEAEAGPRESAEA